MRRLDAHEERVEQVGAVQQRIVLQADPAAVVQERLEVLVVVVQLVLGPKQLLDEFRVADLRILFERFDVGEAADTTGDVGRRKRRAVKGGDDAHHVLIALGRDQGDAKLVRLEPKGFRAKGATHEQLPVDRQAIRFSGRDDQERHRVNRDERARRQHGALDAFLAAVVHERAEIGEVAELGPIDGRLGACGQALADLRDDDTDLARRNLHPRIEGDGVVRPQLEPDARH